MYSGNGYVLHASSYYAEVVESEMRYLKGYAGARRIHIPSRWVTAGWEGGPFPTRAGQHFSMSVRRLRRLSASLRLSRYLPERCSYTQPGSVVNDVRGLTHRREHDQHELLSTKLNC
jgi:hypothetical protein